MIQDILIQAKEASRSTTSLSEHMRSKVLLQVADAIDANTRYILNANKEDLFRMNQEDPKYDRLKLTAERIAGITSDMRAVAALPSPLGKVLESRVRPNGMQIDKVSVPFGVVGVIYEARPNVTADVFGLCFWLVLERPDHFCERVSVAVLQEVDVILGFLAADAEKVDIPFAEWICHESAVFLVFVFGLFHKAVCNKLFLHPAAVVYIEECVVFPDLLRVA